MNMAQGNRIACAAWPPLESDRHPLALWSAQEIAAATGGRAYGVFECSGVEIDSRDCREGDLFVALKGAAMDGHRFIDDALAKGAVAALTERPIDAPHVLVDDTGEALRALARAARDRAEAVRIAVTGSVGKTGVKEAIFAALDRSSRGQAHRSLRSYNNHVGVPLSLARMGARAKYGVFEMGMNHAGEIARLAEQLRPHIAVITTIAPAHIENLGSEEAIADAKAEVLGAMAEDGVAVLPADSAHFERLAAHARDAGVKIVSFGRSPGADVRLLDAIPSANGGSLVTIDMGERRLCYSVAEPGAHWIDNSLAVMAAVRAAGGDLAAAGIALAQMGGLKGRGARHRIAAQGGSALVIDESYNANPASMRATLAQLGQTEATRRIAVLGAMKELGDLSEEFHRRLAEPIREARIDSVILVGEEMAPLARELGKAQGGELGFPVRIAHCANCAEAIATLDAHGLKGGDAVLVKASNAVGLGALVAHLTGR